MDASAATRLSKKEGEINRFRLYQLLLVLSAPARDFRIGCFGEEAGEPRVRVQGCECTEEESPYSHPVGHLLSLFFL